MDIVERLRSPEVFIMDGPMISPVAFEAANEIERLRKNFTHAYAFAKTAWLTESCGTIGDDAYGYELCQIISDKIFTFRQKESE